MRIRIKSAGAGCNNLSMHRVRSRREASSGTSANSTARQGGRVSRARHRAINTTVTSYHGTSRYLKYATYQANL